jgi:FlaA1/EpsC-like NDP-sugar epimerase
MRQKPGTRRTASEKTIKNIRRRSFSDRLERCHIILFLTDLVGNCRMLSSKLILITGGTGSFGKTFTKMALEKINPKKIIIFSRDEMKQWNIAETFRPFDLRGRVEGRVHYVIGDVRDKLALRRNNEWR